MPGTTTKWAMPAGWWTSPISWRSADYDLDGAQLPNRHGFLLGLHADRRRLAHAGAVSLLPPRLYPLHSRLHVLALRSSGHWRKFSGRLFRFTVWHSANVGDRPASTDRRPSDA